ncbi:glyoxalase-like domain protein [Gloeomargarita lithophora]|nr:glyoxalase-like domain protein [Gloeomargarita lithophora]
MVLLLVGYGTALWLFLRGAPKIYTVMASDLELARWLYEEDLGLERAEVPLHYYYNYEQALGLTDPLMSTQRLGKTAPAGFWYQLRKNTQLHLIGGARPAEQGWVRLVCFDRDCLDWLLLRGQMRALPTKILQERPLRYLLRGSEGQTLEFVEVARVNPPARLPIG